MSPAADKDLIVAHGLDPELLFAKTVNGITSNYPRYSVRGGQVFDDRENKVVPKPPDPRLAKITKVLKERGIANPEQVAADVVAELD